MDREQSSAVCGQWPDLVVVDIFVIQELFGASYRLCENDLKFNINFKANQWTYKVKTDNVVNVV